MAISTYAELRSAVAGWLDREDLTARIPDFITLAESAIAAQLAMRTAEGDASLSGVAGSRLIPLPAGYRDGKVLWIVRGSGREALRMIPPDLMEVATAAGEPRAWCVDGVSIAFDRPLDQGYAFVLRMVSELALSEAAPTNLVLANYPNLYLFGTLREAGPYLRDAELTAMFDAKYAEALSLARDMEGRASRRVRLSSEPARLIAGDARYDICSDR